MTNQDEPHAITDTRPGIGIDAAIAAAFDRHPNHPRAKALLARAAQREEILALHRAKMAKLTEIEAATAEHTF